MDTKYNYLFPFEKIPPHSKILLYGGGNIGREYLRQIALTQYCHIVGVLDREADKIVDLPVPVHFPEELTQFSYDYIVVSLISPMVVPEVYAFLLQSGVKKERIVLASKRVENEGLFYNSNNHLSAQISLPTMAYQKTSSAIAVFLGSGYLGDCIQRKSLFMELGRAFPGGLVDIYVSKQDYVYSIYRDQKHLNTIVFDKRGTIFEIEKKKYVFAIHVSFLIQIRHIDYDKAYQISNEWGDKLKILQERCNNYSFFPMTPTHNRILIERAIYQGWNCFSFYNYTSIFHITSSRVPIPMDNSVEVQYKCLNLKSYITINYGNSTIMKNGISVNSKQWPLEYFEQFISLFKKYYPSIGIVQLGDSNAPMLKNADYYYLGRDIELVKYILKGTIFHLDIEGGLMHLATQLGAMCIVLFGPTQVQVFGYPENINIVAPKCNGCYYLYDNQYKCARNLQTAECMYSIFPELVLEKAVSYIENIDDQLSNN